MCCGRKTKDKLITSQKPMVPQAAGKCWAEAVPNQNRNGRPNDGSTEGGHGGHPDQNLPFDRPKRQAVQGGSGPASSLCGQALVPRKCTTRYVTAAEQGRKQHRYHTWKQPACMDLGCPQCLSAAACPTAQA